MPATAWVGPGQSQELGSPFRSPAGVAGVQVLRHISRKFLDAEMAFCPRHGNTGC